MIDDLIRNHVYEQMQTADLNTLTEWRRHLAELVSAIDKRRRTLLMRQCTAPQPRKMSDE